MKAVEVELLMKGNLSQGMLDAQTKANLLDESLKRVGMTIGGVFTAQKAVEFVKTMIDVRQEVENLSISFETLLGSKDKATQFFGELREYAVNTPLMLNELAGGAQTMLGFNIEAEKVIPTLKQIGDISMGDRDRFNSLVLAFSQMSATGKLMGQDLLQMINAGFNPLATISEKTGKSIGQLKDEMSAGAISSEMVAQAFADATAEGGKFHGMLDKQSKGLKGQISNLEGAIDDMFNAMGEKSEGILTGSVEVASELVKNYEAVGKALMSLVAVYGSYKTALIATLAVQKAASFVENIRLVAMFRKELGLATAAQQAFNITANANPYVLLATVILSAAAALAIYSKNCSAAADEAQRAADREKEQTDAINDKKEAIEKCISTITDENLAELDRVEALEKLKKLMPSVFEKYKTEKELIDKLTDGEEISVEGKVENLFVRHIVLNLNLRHKKKAVRHFPLFRFQNKPSAAITTTERGWCTAKVKTDAASVYILPLDWRRLCYARCFEFEHCKDTKKHRAVQEKGYQSLSISSGSVRLSPLLERTRQCPGRSIMCQTR